MLYAAKSDAKLSQMCLDILYYIPTVHDGRIDGGDDPQARSWLCHANLLISA